MATGEVGEATEGLLVTTVGTITQGPQNDLPFGFKLSIDDGTGELVIFVNVQTGIDLSGFAVGQRVSVTGFSGQFDDHYEVLPRSPEDLLLARPLRRCGQGVVARTPRCSRATGDEGSVLLAVDTHAAMAGDHSSGGNSNGHPSRLRARRLLLG